MAVRLSTKIWHGTALLVLLVCDRTWCDLCRGGPRPSHTARLARRAPPAKQGGPRPTNPARRPRRGLQPPLQLVRQVPLPGVIKTISNGQTLVQLLWRVRGAQQLSPFTGILLQAPRASRLQEGSEVWVHVLPIGDRLTLRLVGDDAPPGQSAFFRQLSGPKKAGAADKSQVEWSPKQGLKDSLNWMDAEPLPHCLNGAAAPHLQGKVTRVDPSMAIVRLFWEAPPGLSDPELSPIAAALPVEALQKFFALTTVPLCSDYLQEGQLVSVQLQDPDDSEDLTVSLSPLQPMPPRPPPPCAGGAVSMAWQPLCGSNAPCRVIDATEAAWRRTPGDATSAMEEFGFSELWKLKTTNTLATLAFAVSETKQDVVITGAIPRAERMALLALLVAQHLVEAAPQELVLLLAPCQCLMQLDKLEEALTSFEAALRLDSQCISAQRNKALLLAKQRRWHDAILSFREALSVEPTQELRMELARCLTEHAIQLKASGHGDLQLFHEAIQACDSYAPAFFQLGVCYSEVNDSIKAKEMYRKAVQLHPGYVEALNNLGVACRELGEWEHAIEAYGMALKVNQNCSKTRENMAISLLQLGCRHLQRKELKEAGKALKQGLSFNSRNADIYFNLGVLYAEKEKWDQAKVNYELASNFDPRHANAHNNLGVIHRRLGNPEAAMKCFESALEVDSKMNLASKNLGAIYGSMGRMDDAIRLTRVAIDSNRQDAEAYNNLALLLRDQCDVDACLENLDICISLEPESRHAGSNRLMSLNYQSERSREEVFEAHRSWGSCVESSVSQVFSWDGARGNSGPLRVGYISPDFYSHSVSYFIHSALKYHDPAFVAVTCYSDVALEDDKTRQFKELVPQWRTICGRRDDEVAKLIYDDGIDILVDLTGHTGNNRLGVFARKPAPVCITWIGYPHTTGLTRMDYRISDEFADPKDAPGLTTEKILYLPECFLCYTPPETAPPVVLKPAQESYGCITFGCFNNLAKVSSLTIRMWSKLLHEVPGSRLFVKSKALACPKVQDKMRAAFAVHGIQASRLDLTGLQPQTGSHLHMYSFIDVALDTAPYAGTTTTCEALYMGVPVVTLKGRGIHAQNVGASLLSAVQLGDLVIETEEDFVKQAAACAKNLPRLAALRAGLRTRMLRSVLCDGPRHVARLERLYAGVISDLARSNTSALNIQESATGSLAEAQ